MTNVIKLFKNGGQIISDVEDVREYVISITKENEALKLLIEKQGATIVSIFEGIGDISRKLNGVQDILMMNNETTNEIKHKKFIGQTMEVLPQIYDKIKIMSGDSRRKTIDSACRMLGKKGKGHTEFYLRLEQLTGVNVMSFGKITLKKSDGIDGWRKDPTYLNVIFREGIDEEATALALQVLADK